MLTKEKIVEYRTLARESDEMDFDFLQDAINALLDERRTLIVMVQTLAPRAQDYLLSRPFLDGVEKFIASAE